MKKTNLNFQTFAKIVCVLLLFILLLSFSNRSFAAGEKGKLGSFEDSLDSKNEDKRSADQETLKHGEPGVAQEQVAASIFETLFGMFLAGTFEMAQEEDKGYVYRTLKKEYSPALVTFKLEGDYNWIAGNDHSASGRAEVGYLMFGLDGEFKRFWENNPSDTLNVVSAHGLLRALFGEVFEIHLALGVKDISGDRNHEGFEFGLPFKAIFTNNIFWDVRPYMAFVHKKQIYDISTGLNFKYKMIGARAGYRAINVDSQTLHGPEVGLFFQY